MLGGGETAQAHGPAAQLALDTGQVTGGAQGARSVQHRIDQGKEEQTQVISQLKFAGRIAPGGVGGFDRPEPVQMVAQRLNESPLTEVFLPQGLGRFHKACHAVSGAESRTRYKLQLGDRSVTFWRAPRPPPPYSLDSDWRAFPAITTPITTGRRPALRHKEKSARICSVPAITAPPTIPSWPRPCVPPVPGRRRGRRGCSE